MSTRPKVSFQQDPRQQQRHSSSGGGMAGLKNRIFSSSDLRGLDFSEQKADGFEIQKTLEELAADQEASRLSATSGGSLLQDLLNISPFMTDAAAALVDDSFMRCFQQHPPDPWNWNVYLFPTWVLGSVVRYCILFPLRLLLLLVGFLLFFIAFFGARACMKPGHRRRNVERTLVQWQCWIFVASWTGVIKYHGPRPESRAGAVWVSNHTSMIDYIILTAYSPFAVIMQLHAGWVGFLQTQVLGCLGCLWFNRNEVKDRALVAQRMKAHVAGEDQTPLLIFPEGTCVNNEYCVMFKRGAFDIGATVYPIAIKYNKIFVDAFWNSRKQSFTAHLFKLMTSWAVVCDVYFLPPARLEEDETAQQFAERVQRQIAKRAKLTIAPWDGYLKYYNLGTKHPDLVEKRRKAFGDNLRTYLITAQAGDKGGLDNGSTRPGVNGVIREDGPEEPESAGAGDGDGSGRHSDSYNLRRRGTAPA